MMLVISNAKKKGCDCYYADDHGNAEDANEGKQQGKERTVLDMHLDVVTWYSW